MNETTMLGTYTLDGNVPVEPEIVLANCSDQAMVGQLVAAFQGNPDVRFFLVENTDQHPVDLNADFHFVRDSGNWVLANHNTLMDVLFDDAGFNPTGSQATFSLDAADAPWSTGLEDAAMHAPLLSSDDQLLADHEPFGADADAGHGHAPETFYVDPSVLAQGEHEILVPNFTLGHDTLELADGLSIKDVVVDAEHDLTQVVLGGDNTPDDIVVKLLGVHQADMPTHEFALATDADGDDLISHMIHSGLHRD